MEATRLLVKSPLGLRRRPSLLEMGALTAASGAGLNARCAAVIAVAKLSSRHLQHIACQVLAAPTSSSCWPGSQILRHLP